MRLSKSLAAIFSVVALTAQAPTPPPTTSTECPAPAVDTRAFLTAPNAFAVAAPSGTLRLVPVATEAARERGLMCVVSVPPGRGMIFVFVADGPQNFWMKNTLVPLDMVFIDGTGRVTSVAADVPATRAGTPDDAVAHGRGNGRYVIELAAGDAARHGIAAGVVLPLPHLTAKE